MTTGKNYIAIKVYSPDCDVCQHMSRHDTAVFSEFSDIDYHEVLLDDIIKHENDPTKLRLYRVLERYALNPDYTIDLPVYAILTTQGEYKGHSIGAATIVELRDSVKEALDIPLE